GGPGRLGVQEDASRVDDRLPARAVRARPSVRVPARPAQRRRTALAGETRRERVPPARDRPEQPVPGRGADAAAPRRPRRRTPETPLVALLRPPVVHGRADGETPAPIRHGRSEY